MKQKQMFFWNSCFFDDPMDVGNLISRSSAFSKSSLNIWKFTIHVLLKPGLENFEHYLASVWDECNCAVVWTFFGIAFLWDWNENWPFPAPSCWQCWAAALLSAAWAQAGATLLLWLVEARCSCLAWWADALTHGCQRSSWCCCMRGQEPGRSFRPGCPSGPRPC